MKPYFESGGVTIYHGDCREILPQLTDRFDACITDPPYGLEFMGKEWDAPWKANWQNGGGFSKPGIGERKTEWPSFSANSRFGAAKPTCATCGGRARGAKRCACETPDWKPIGKRRNAENEGLPDDMTGTGKIAQMAGFQAWCQSWAVEVLNVLKPGAMMLAFGGTRTNHRLACAIEDAGFEIRDMLMWLYGSGFPKSLDISKAIDKQAGAEREVVSIGTPVKRMIPGADQNNTGSWIKDDSREFVPTETLPSTESAKLWDGYGTALKPAYEPIILGMKPVDGTFAGNALKHGVAGLNIDESRIGGELRTYDLKGGENLNRLARPDGDDNGDARSLGAYGVGAKQVTIGEKTVNGRWPSNVILDEDTALFLDEQTGETSVTGARSNQSQSATVEGTNWLSDNHKSIEYPNESGGASRFFYTAKAGSGERSANMTGATNNHPTVKPLDLMRYLCRLLAPPRGGILLEPFMGSGSTVIAGRAFFDRVVACEIEEKYCEIAVARLSQEVLEFA